MPDRPYKFVSFSAYHVQWAGVLLLQIRSMKILEVCTTIKSIPGCLRFIMKEHRDNSLFKKKTDETRMPPILYERK